ncbi:hypothetical protein SNOG_06033 [Parastagonospora nodorum SN15]|uniref:NAD(P)-binding protein n=1 Tax=Phaeosphaeria nodorum (strain SN15 / ATCC MYA-4574 / FGSC 10173) TaxID=321614 RepID=Q0UQD1_PHANO|nr:hypothetical protein SNOG_06033 [Parastagonospora nodorum SN15]EAT87097.2 hypothetical protein SNOG_06033 [Parastagonospora nodorum SN15]
MTSFEIPDSALEGIKDQVVIITGLATLRRIIKHGGKVFASDVNDLPEPEASSVPFQKVDVTSWKDQVELFKAAEKHYTKINHVFANAGIAPTINLMEDDVDENGDLLPPKLNTLNVNLTGCMYTVKLGIFYLKKNPNGGTTSKHAVLGLLRALTPNLTQSPHPIRINAIAPSWTATNIVPQAVISALGEGNYQSADVVGRSVTLLMADEKRHGELVYSECGRFMDLENGERGYHELTKRMLGVEGELRETSVLRGLREKLEGKGEGEKGLEEVVVASE